MNVITVGTGAPRNFVRSGRHCTSTLIYVANQALLFDCGGGTTINLLRSQIKPWDINALFFTHHHYDHNADYGLFVLARWDLAAGAAKKLQVYGPEGTVRITELLFGPDGVFGRDIDARTKWHGHLWAYQDIGGKLPRQPVEVEARELTPELTLEFDGFKITTALAVHAQPWLDSLAYRIDSDEGSVVITGDTTYAPTVVHLARGADMMVGWESTPIEPFWSCAQMAAAANVKKLVIHHLGYPSTDDRAKRMLTAARETFSGEVIMSEDLMEIQV